MGYSVNYRLMQPGEEPRVVDLIFRVFSQFVAPLYSTEGVTEFMKYVDASVLADRTKGDRLIRVAESNGDIIGVMETRGRNHIALFFVATEYQRKGIGRELLNRAIQECISVSPESTGITVNSSPNAVSAYRALGFMEKGEERTVNGIRSVPMELEISESRHGEQ